MSGDMTFGQIYAMCILLGASGALLLGGIIGLLTAPKPSRTKKTPCGHLKDWASNCQICESDVVIREKNATITRLQADVARLEGFHESCEKVMAENAELKRLHPSAGLCDSILKRAVERAGKAEAQVVELTAKRTEYKESAEKFQDIVDHGDYKRGLEDGAGRMENGREKAEASLEAVTAELEAAESEAGSLREMFVRPQHGNAEIESMLTGATARADRAENKAVELAVSLRAQTAVSARLREALEDCQRYFDHASRKNLLPEGAVKAYVLVHKALSLTVTEAEDSHASLLAVVEAAKKALKECVINGECNCFYPNGSSVEKCRGNCVPAIADRALARAAAIRSGGDNGH